MPAPVVNRHPRTPAHARGIPKTKQKAIQIEAAELKLEPLPSVAAPWGIASLVVGSTISMPPVSFLVTIWDLGRRRYVGNTNGDAKASVKDWQRKSQNSIWRRRAAAMQRKRMDETAWKCYLKGAGGISTAKGFVLDGQLIARGRRRKETKRSTAVTRQ